MNASAFYDSFLLKQFHRFYGEVIAQKRRLSAFEGDDTEETEHGRPSGSADAEAPSKTGASGQDAGAEPSDDDAEAGPHREIFNRLLTVLEEQVQEARRMGGEYGVKYYREAQYVMAALADEILLHTPWAGSEAWKSNLLEFKLFGTYVAGEQFFRNVQALLKEQDPARVEIGAIYFLALSLGFMGKYRDIDDQGLLDHYRRELFGFIYRKNPEVIGDSRQMFPDSYAHTLTQGPGDKLPYIRWWVGLIVLLVIVYLGGSHILWTHMTQDLIKVVDVILRNFNPLG